MKKIISMTVLAAGLVAAASSAQAADRLINLYGASAQKDFWTDLGPGFLTATTANNGAGCTNAYRAAYAGDANFGAIKGENCTSNGGGNVYITYGSVASLEGIKAAKGVAPIDDKHSCAATNGNAYRQIVDVSTCTWSTTGIGSCTAVTCGDVTLGASDVAGESFTQESHGGKNGWYDATQFDVVLSPESTTGLYTYRPTVVPFAFFVNNGADTTTYPGLTNVSRVQAANIFAGKVYDWGQFDGGANTKYPAGMGVVACLRHAGSGTHATLDKGVMRGDLPLATNEQIFGMPGMAADIQFFQSSSGEKRCVAENGGYGPVASGGYLAVGYADADAVYNAAKDGGSGTGMTRLNYEGVDATDTNIANGDYSFWSHQWVYLQPADNDSLVQKMMAYASAHVPASKVGMWLPANGLKVNKATDTSLPVFP